MKKIYSYSVAILIATILLSCDPTPAPTPQPTPVPEPKPLASMPYTISVSESATQPTGAYGIQSSAHGFDGTHLMMVGGRIQGFHGTANANGVFDSKYANDKISILNPVTGDFKFMDLPEKYKTILSATNMEYYYDGTYLICVGGYGSYCTTCKPEQFRTYPRITAINFQEAVTAIESNDASGLEASIITLRDERFRVTGGGLERIDDYYFLVFGQSYDTIYIGGITGKYTEEVRKFKLDIATTGITVSDYETYADPNSQTDEFSQYHRRDLNVCSAIRPDGSEAITALGGVFTKNDGGWVNPILVDGATTTKVSIFTGLEQKLSQYECSLVSFYDPTTKTMFHTLMGGISYYFYQDGVLTPSTINNWLPFTSSITTIVQNEAGMQEFPQPESQSLPKLMGSDAAFIPDPSLSYLNDSKTIIDLSKISGSNVHVGWIFGGIDATAPQSDEFNPTSAGKVLYDVILNLN